MTEKKKTSVRIGWEVVLLMALGTICLVTGVITGMWWLQGQTSADLETALLISLPLCLFGFLFGYLAYRAATGQV